jgi:hypothetical protein
MEHVENSPAVRPTVARRPPANRHGSASPPPASRSRSTNDPRFLPKQPLSRRALDRRRKDLVSSFLAALGGPEAVNDLAMLQVRRCAELQAMCEMARANMLNGVATDMLALVRLEGVAARALRLLGIKVEQPPARARGLELARQRWAEQAQERARKAGGATANLTEPPNAGTAE